jgi:hypothetical protein
MRKLETSGAVIRCSHGAARLRSSTLVALVACAAVALAGRASAQQPDLEKARTAQALYDQAVSALDRKDFAGACPKLEEVVRLEPKGIGAKITLAECYEGAGKLASAATTYELAEAAAAAAGQAERQKKAHDRAVALKPRLGHLTVTVSPEMQALAGLQIQRDGVPVGAAQWGLAFPADQGEHRVVATATGKERWEQVVVLADGTEAQVLVGPLHDAQAVAAVAPVAPGADAGHGRKVGGIVALSVGGALLTAGAILLVLDLTACYPTTSNLDCDNFSLNPPSPPPYGVFAAVGLAAGGAAMVTGIVLLATLPKPAPGPVAVEPLIGPGYVGIRGAF